MAPTRALQTLLVSFADRSSSLNSVRNVVGLTVYFSAHWEKACLPEMLFFYSR